MATVEAGFCLPARDLVLSGSVQLSFSKQSGKVANDFQLGIPWCQCVSDGVVDVLGGSSN